MSGDTCGLPASLSRPVAHCGLGGNAALELACGAVSLLSHLAPMVTDFPGTKSCSHNTEMHLERQQVQGWGLPLGSWNGSDSPPFFKKKPSYVPEGDHFSWVFCVKECNDFGLFTCQGSAAASAAALRWGWGFSSVISFSLCCGLFI